MHVPINFFVPLHLNMCQPTHLSEISTINWPNSSELVFRCMRGLFYLGPLSLGWSKKFHITYYSEVTLLVPNYFFNRHICESPPWLTFTPPPILLLTMEQKSPGNTKYHGHIVFHISEQKNSGHL